MRAFAILSQLAMPTFLSFKPYLLLLLLLLLLGCQQESKKSQKNAFFPSDYSLESLNGRYGSPVEQQQYLVTEEEDEFRTLVLSAFPDSIRRKHSIKIWEYTWSTDMLDSMITVWYLPSNDSLSYICHFSHSTYNLY